MPLPKGIKAALDTWKAGTGEFPTDLDDGVFFPNTGAFDAEVKRKAKGIESQAREAALAKFLADSGLTDESQIAELKETLEKSGALKTESEKTKGELAKMAKLLEDSKKETKAQQDITAGLTGKLKGGAKRDALAKYLPKVSDPDLFTLYMDGLLEVADDFAVKVKGDDKKTLDVLVEETLKAKPALKSPTFKDGTGVKPTPTTTIDPKLPFQPAEGKDLPRHQQMINELVSKGAITAPQAPQQGGP